VITFHFTQPRAESGSVRLEDPIDMLLGIVADARFLADDRLLLSMPAFPLVELAAQLDYWLKQGGDKDFSYESAEAEDELLWFRTVDDHWFVGSDLADAPTKHETTHSAATEFARTYIDRVKDEVRHALGIDVSPAVQLRK
jgi:hypothetical protein